MEFLRQLSGWELGSSAFLSPNSLLSSCTLLNPSARIAAKASLSSRSYNPLILRGLSHLASSALAGGPVRRSCFDCPADALASRTKHAAIVTRQYFAPIDRVTLLEFLAPISMQAAQLGAETKHQGTTAAAEFQKTDHHRNFLNFPMTRAGPVLFSASCGLRRHANSERHSLQRNALHPHLFSTQLDIFHPQEERTRLVRYLSFCKLAF